MFLMGQRQIHAKWYKQRSDKRQWIKNDISPNLLLSIGCFSQEIYNKTIPSFSYLYLENKTK